MVDKRPNRPPVPQPMRLEALINSVNEGRIKIPTFQRREIWNSGQVSELLDSVRKGYPIGSLLFWRTDHEMKSERDVGGFELPDTPAKTPRDYVLDGQQRLTVLYAVASRDPATLDDRYRILYDLRSGEFVDFTEPREPWQISLNILYDMDAFIEAHKLLGDQEDHKKLGTELNSLYHTFHEYQIPVTVTLDTPLDHVGVIFERINRTGTRLTLLDLMVAATWGTVGGEEFDLREKINDVTESLGEKDFDEVEGVTVLRTMSAIEAGSAQREKIEGLRTKSTVDLMLLLERTREALARAIDFLASELAAKSVDFLPYERQMVLTSYVLANKFPLSAEGVSSLRRWFWLSSFKERYRRGGEKRNLTKT